LLWHPQCGCRRTQSLRRASLGLSGVDQERRRTDIERGDDGEAILGIALH